MRSGSYCVSAPSTRPTKRLILHRGETETQVPLASCTCFPSALIASFTQSIILTRTWSRPENGLTGLPSANPTAKRSPAPTPRSCSASRQSPCVHRSGLGTVTLRMVGNSETDRLPVDGSISECPVGSSPTSPMRAGLEHGFCCDTG